MCPHCRAFITTSDRVCPYCGDRVGPKAIDVRAPAAILGMIPAANFTTVLILLINVALYIATQYMASGIGQNGALWAFGGKYGPSIARDHQWWRLVTAGFLHGGLLHIAMNSWVLYDLGAQVEEVFGTPRFLAIYFFGTVAGFYLSFRMNPILSIGSSAGIMGLVGAMIAFGVLHRSSVGTAIRNHYARYVVYMLAFGFIGGFGVDNWAHIGGLLGGFAIAWAAGTPVHSSPTKESAWRAAAGGCLVITVYCFFLMYRAFPPPEALR